MGRGGTHADRWRAGMAARLIYMTTSGSQAHLSALLMLLKDAGSADNVLWALGQLGERFVTPDRVSDFLETHGGL